MDDFEILVGICIGIATIVYAITQGLTWVETMKRLRDDEDLMARYNRQYERLPDGSPAKVMMRELEDVADFAETFLHRFGPGTALYRFADTIEDITDKITGIDDEEPNETNGDVPKQGDTE